MGSVSDPEDLLKAVGIPRLDPEGSPDLYAELYRIARRVREAGRTVVGLLPTGPDVAVAPLAVELAFALADACEGAVAVVDANTRWPALQGVTSSKDERSKKSGYRTTWIESFLAIMTPIETSEAMRLDGLDRLLMHETQGFTHMLVDLTGFEKAGEHWGMLDAIDGVLLVGHPGLTREHEILRLHEDIPATKILGVILVG
jgi:hypothetical protein